MLQLLLLDYNAVLRR